MMNSLFGRLRVCGELADMVMGSQSVLDMFCS